MAPVVSVMSLTTPAAAVTLHSVRTASDVSPVWVTPIATSRADLPVTRVYVRRVTSSRVEVAAARHPPVLSEMVRRCVLNVLKMHSVQSLMPHNV